jgi:hypothetical protein
LTIWRMRNASWIPKAINTLTIYSYHTYCFSTSIIVGRKRLIVTLYEYLYWMFLFTTDLKERNFL